MKNQTERVWLLVNNQAGVLMRVTGQIRREGWNIKSLSVDETDDATVSLMDIYIEGARAKLTFITEKLMRLDCVIKAGIVRNGEELVIEQPPKKEAVSKPERNEERPAPPKKAGAFRILTINPGSTSTKFAVYDDEEAALTGVVRHERKMLDECGSIFGQRELRRESIMGELSRRGVDERSLDAIAGRGGLVKPIESGTYIINDAMLRDLGRAAASVHASALGAIIAAVEAEKLDIPAYVVDPIVVDEIDPLGRLTGMPGIERMSIFHALNQKAIARRAASDMGKKYEDCRFVVAHLGGGITVGAHWYGRVIDVNDAIAGEGPFTPERTGSLPAGPLIEMCYSGEYTKDEMIERVTKSGGMQSYLGTNDLKTAQKMIDSGDDFAALVVDSMAYQVCKEIGSMMAVLEGRADAIILTGGLAYSSRFTGFIKERVDALAPVRVYPGEDEMLALMSGALRVLRGEETAREYE